MKILVVKVIEIRAAASCWSIINPMIAWNPSLCCPLSSILPQTAIQPHHSSQIVICRAHKVVPSSRCFTAGKLFCSFEVLKHSYFAVLAFDNITKSDDTDDLNILLILYIYFRHHAPAGVGILHKRCRHKGWGTTYLCKLGWGQTDHFYSMMWGGGVPVVQYI